MDHLEAVVELKNIIDIKFIEKLVPFIKHKAKNDLTVRSGVRKDIRNVKGYSLDLTTPTNLFYWNFVKQEINRLYFHYKYKFPLMMSNKINQIDLLKYSPGGKYEVHTDHYTTSPRHLTIIMNLNSDYEGGDLVFTDQKEKEIKRFNLGKGSIVFFPSNFMYPHSLQPITKGTRYSIVSWLQ
jgi:predicted 2-oxoglutarate/Fe(II)-dependent dioxygenase YbiX|tara:strand:- start:360 stop:905 length:546 start_codon:yes stop_codon:yes gene_type:complete